MKKVWTLVIVTVIACFAVVAQAHTASPSFTTFSNGTVLTASALNDNFSHIHNTLNGGITNTHISASAAIAYSKLSLTGQLLKADLSVPALLPRAWGRQGADVGVACDAALAAGTTCTNTTLSQVTSVTTTGSAGQYRVNLSYTPANADFTVNVTVMDGLDVVCSANNFQTATPNFIVKCRETDGTPADVNSKFSFVVMDDN